MSRIETTYDLSRDLTIFKAVGTMEAAHFNDYLQRFNEAGFTTQSMWDLSEAELSEITTDEIRSLALHGSQLAATVTGGKTALVFNSLFEYGLGRIFQTFVEMNMTPFEVELFLSLDEAMEWLGV